MFQFSPTIWSVNVWHTFVFLCFRSRICLKFDDCQSSRIFCGTLRSLNPLPSSFYSISSRSNWIFSFNIVFFRSISLFIFIDPFLWGRALSIALISQGSDSTPSDMFGWCTHIQSTANVWLMEIEIKVPCFCHRYFSIAVIKTNKQIVVRCVVVVVCIEFGGLMQVFIVSIVQTEI